MIKLKELGIQQVILYEYLKEQIKTVDDLDDMLIHGLDCYFDSFKEAPVRVKSAYNAISSKYEVEVIYFVTQHILKKEK